LPSAILLVLTAKEDRSGISIDENAKQHISQIQSLIPQKRNTPLHVVVLVTSHKSYTGSAERGEKILRQHRDAALQESFKEYNNLPSSHVNILREGDLQNDEWTERVMTSPYSNTPNHAERKILSLPMRQLVNSILSSSSRYYSLLGEHAERKLTLWRNRYHTTNASFEWNTLICIVRCARYGLKSGVFRQLEQGSSQSSNQGGVSTRHYEESYRWVMELHRRIHRYKSISSLNVPVTPGVGGASPEVSSPKVTESPGGGIGVELSLPSVAEVPLAPQGTPAFSSKRNSYDSFYSSLYLQSLSVAGLLNDTLLKCQHSMKDLERMWRRHRSIFLASTNDASFYGPKWYHIQYYSQQLHQYAQVSERLWRNDVTYDPQSLNSSYFSDAAPWGIYKELCEVILRLGGEMKRLMEKEGWKDPEEESATGGSKRYLGMIVGGESWKKCFETEAGRKHGGESDVVAGTLL
jgi:hypothetical protein